ncbi:MAG: LD-carboxypeptidase [Oscillospiraceae bacterium]|nr:LD-carboxypeptidase [Oscillospiraceae bacterium]
MIKTVAIVSLSSGIQGESFVRHELEIGLRRLRAYGLTVRLMPHALSGEAYCRAHPEARAADLLAAFRDPEVDMILCAIGGDDTYRLLPWLFGHDELHSAACDKIFLGFSDTTINHLMLHKVGLRSFYGQAFLPDVCELADEMLPYTRQYFEELLATGTIREIVPSKLWYESREAFDADRIGTMPAAHADRGFELLQGGAVFSGKILGGCIDTLYDIFDGGRYADMPVLCERYALFPSEEDWRGRILLLESSEEKMPPEKYRAALRRLKDAGVFGAVSGVLVGKPMDEAYDREYREALIEVIDDQSLPVVCNLNVGHAAPRCIIPFGVNAVVDADQQRITFSSDL